MKDRKLNRRNDWNYCKPGWYFVTVCSEDKGDVFGVIKDNKMIVNKYGVVVGNKIGEIKNHFLGINVDDYVIMPNHVHLLIWVKFSVGNAYMRSNGKEADQNWERNAYMRLVLPVKRADMLIPKAIQNFKAAVSRELGMKIWQKSYHDEIVRNNEMLVRIRKYIKDNPKNWNRDKNNPNL